HPRGRSPWSKAEQKGNDHPNVASPLSSVVGCQAPGVVPSVQAVTETNPSPPVTKPAMSYRSHWRNLGRNYGYLLPGMPLAVVSFSLLLPLLTLSISTLIVWVGVVILPATLILGSTFASLSRARAERWGEAIPAPVYQPAGAGIRRATTIILDPRRWLDLFFEPFIARPLRLTTFVISLTWSAIGLGGLTYGLWSLFVPGDSGWISLLKLTSPSAVPGTVAGQNALDI